MSRDQVETMLITKSYRTRFKNWNWPLKDWTSRTKNKLLLLTNLEENSSLYNNNHPMLLNWTERLKLSSTRSKFTKSNSVLSLKKEMLPRDNYWKPKVWDKELFNSKLMKDSWMIQLRDYKMNSTMLTLKMSRELVRTINWIPNKFVSLN